MENPGWVRLVVVGLVLAALAIGYFLLSGSFVKTKPKSDVSNRIGVVETPAPDTSIKVATASPTPKPAVNGQPASAVQTLPATGFPLALIVVLSAGATVAGLGLRKFPK